VRTPNCKCLVCEKPLYRRPFELAKVRHVACMEHRALAQSISGVTEAQAAGLSRGRQKGTNHRTGYRHREESRLKASESHKKFCAENPDRVLARSLKLRGENHYRWAGGVSKLNLSIRRMTENRRWMDAVKARDGKCLRCGTTEGLESHHKTPLSDIMSSLGIKSREDARRHAATLWDLENGETLCMACHDDEHGRARRAQAA
jgi:5-methylcytosine-specific restriction endonuclease McrA